MPDIDNVMGVDAGDIDSIMGVSAGDIDTVMGVTLVTAQAYEGQIFLIGGGNTDPYSNTDHEDSIQKKSSTSNGDSSSFGDMISNDLKEHAASGGGGRGIVGAQGNERTDGAENQNIYYVTFASDGNATDTSDNVAHTHEGVMGCGNGVKMGFAGGFSSAIGYPNGYMADMQRYTIAGGSNSADIGNLQYGGGYDVYNGSTSTRWVMAGGYDPTTTYSLQEDINYMTWASEGNASDAGNLTARRTHGKSTINSESRIIFHSSTSSVIGGDTTESRTHQMDYINPATTDDAEDFGDDVGDDGSDDADSATRGGAGNFQDGTRGEFWCGDAVSGNSYGNYTDSIRYLTIASLGDTTDAGNETAYDGRSNMAGLCGT